LAREKEWQEEQLQDSHAPSGQAGHAPTGQAGHASTEQTGRAPTEQGGWSAGMQAAAIAARKAGRWLRRLATPRFLRPFCIGIKKISYFPLNVQNQSIKNP
jgi:hypothetical protein